MVKLKSMESFCADKHFSGKPAYFQLAVFIAYTPKGDVRK